MIWKIVSGPSAVGSGGYDATVWRWDLGNDESSDAVACYVQISGTAMATQDASLPSLVREARRTSGRSVVEEVLEWVVPPARIELNTTSERPRTFGGVPPVRDADESPTETAKIRELVAWFAINGIELEIERQGNGWNALMIPQNVRLGAADYGRGETRLVAAEDAQRRFSSRTGVPFEHTSAGVEISTADRVSS